MMIIERIFSRLCSINIVSINFDGGRPPFELKYGRVPTIANDPICTSFGKQATNAQLVELRGLNRIEADIQLHYLNWYSQGFLTLVSKF